MEKLHAGLGDPGFDLLVPRGTPEDLSGYRLAHWFGTRSPRFRTARPVRADQDTDHLPHPPGGSESPGLSGLAAERICVHAADAGECHSVGH